MGCGLLRNKEVNGGLYNPKLTCFYVLRSGYQVLSSSEKLVKNEAKPSKKWRMEVVIIFMVVSS